jgi:hypothetical protein
MGVWTANEGRVLPARPLHAPVAFGCRRGGSVSFASGAAAKAVPSKTGRLCIRNGWQVSTAQDFREPDLGLRRTMVEPGSQFGPLSRWPPAPAFGFFRTVVFTKPVNFLDRLDDEQETTNRRSRDQEEYKCDEEYACRSSRFFRVSVAAIRTVHAFRGRRLRDSLINRKTRNQSLLVCQLTGE